LTQLESGSFPRLCATTIESERKVTVVNPAAAKIETMNKDTTATFWEIFVFSNMPISPI
jgi:hypothetical protein